VLRKIRAIVSEQKRADRASTKGQRIKAPWLFCPAENALQNGGVLPGSLGRALVGYRLTKSRPARGKKSASRPALDHYDFLLPRDQIVGLL